MKRIALVLLSIALLIAGFVVITKSPSTNNKPEIIVNPSQNSASTDTGPKFSSTRPIQDQLLEEYLQYIEPLMETNNMLAVLDTQITTEFECKGYASYSELCKGKNPEDVVSGYQIARYLSEGTVTTKEEAVAQWKEYQSKGPYTFLAIETKEDTTPHREVYFSSAQESKALALVLEEENGHWYLVNSYYGIPTEEIEARAR